MLNEPTEEHLELFYSMIKGFRDWGVIPHSWPNQFMRDSELNWQDGFTPVADI
ncbi:MAG: hypothetical protein WDZ91_11585 [Paenibacillaceae bacterium]